MQGCGFGAERSRNPVFASLKSQTYGSMSPVKWYDLTREHGP
jgi:hypothetical protein